MSAVLVVDAEALAHLSVALRRHVEEARTRGYRVPAEVAGLARAVSSARGRHEVPSMADDDFVAHLGRMYTQLALDYDEAARRLGVSRRSVQRLVSDGSLPTVEIAGAPRVRVADLAAYIEDLPRRSFRDRVSNKEVAA